MKTKNTTPLERHEQIAFVQYLEALQKRGYDIIFSATAQSTYTTSIKQKVTNKAMGVRKGLPDLFIIIEDVPLFIEMKRRKGGVVSLEQRMWHEKINGAGIRCYTCYGSDDAMQTLDPIIKQSRFGFH